MVRPHCPRIVSGLPAKRYFKPIGVPRRELCEVVLSVDEYEAIRLADGEGLYHEQAAALMNISRPTFGRILQSARRKIAEALVNGKAIRIEGGVIEVADMRRFQCDRCGRSWEVPHGGGRPEECPYCHGLEIHRAHDLASTTRGRRRCGHGGGRRRCRE